MQDVSSSNLVNFWYAETTRHVGKLFDLNLTTDEQ